MLDIEGIIFWIFATLLVGAALMVVTSRNPVYAVLFLIFAFFNAAGLFILLGAEYLAMTLVIVYVGAVAILFLFVVMMLDIKYTAVKRSFVRYLPIGGGLAALLFMQFRLLMEQGMAEMQSKPGGVHPIPNPDTMNNAEAIGSILYTEYIYTFQIAGLILLVAMIGAIVLTLRSRKNVRKQNIHTQVTRKGTADLVDVQTGSGV